MKSEMTDVKCKKCGANNTIPTDISHHYQKFYYTCWYCGWVYAYQVYNTPAAIEWYKREK